MVATLLVIGVAAGILTVTGGVGVAFNRWNRRRRMRNWNYSNSVYEELEEDYAQNYNSY